MLRARKNFARNRFKAADDSEKEGLWATYQGINAEHSALYRTQRFCPKRRKSWNSRERFVEESIQYARGLFEQPRLGALNVGKEKPENHLI